MPGPIIFKLLKGKEKILKIAREGKTYCIQRNKNKDYNKLCQKRCQVRRQWSDNLKMLKEKNCPASTLYQVKIFFIRRNKDSLRQTKTKNSLPADPPYKKY